MRIFGIGIDVVEVERIGSSLAEFGDAFVRRVFTDSERRYCESQKHPEIHYAARFAVKEAVAKALGTGIGSDLEWLDMEVVRSDIGAPAMVLGGRGKAFAARQGVREVKISLSHTRHYAVANAVALAGDA
jgi:holo-[acyl-carrier protein] synthase